MSAELPVVSPPAPKRSARKAPRVPCPAEGCTYSAEPGSSIAGHVAMAHPDVPIDTVAPKRSASPAPATVSPAVAGARNPRGYGRIRDDAGRLIYAHRAALALALGRPLQPGMFANHRCDWKPCIRPSHLYEGTQSENERDKHYWGPVIVPKGDVISTLPMFDERQERTA